MIKGSLKCEKKNPVYGEIKQIDSKNALGHEFTLEMTKRLLILNKLSRICSGFLSRIPKVKYLRNIHILFQHNFGLFSDPSLYYVNLNAVLNASKKFF